MPRVQGTEAEVVFWTDAQGLDVITFSFCLCSHAWWYIAIRAQRRKLFVQHEWSFQLTDENWIARKWWWLLQLFPFSPTNFYNWKSLYNRLDYTSSTLLYIMHSDASAKSIQQSPFDGCRTHLYICFKRTSKCIQGVTCWRHWYHVPRLAHGRWSCSWWSGRVLACVKGTLCMKSRS